MPMEPGSQFFMYNPHMNPGTKPITELGALQVPNRYRNFVLEIILEQLGT